MLRNRSITRSKFINNVDEGIELSDVIQIIKSNDCVILYSPWCGYSKKALSLLNQGHVPYMSIDIEKIDATMNEIRSRLARERGFKFPESYSTRPMIFMNGKFIGGYTELINLLS